MGEFPRGTQFDYEACSSTKHNGNRYQMLYNSYHTSGTDYHLGSKPPYSKNTELMCISMRLLDRTIRKN